MFEDWGNGMVIDTSTGDVYDSNSAEYLGNDSASYFGQDYVSAGSENSPYGGWSAPDYSVAGDGSVTFTDGTVVNADGSISTGGQTYTPDQVKADPSLFDKISGVVSNSNFLKAAGIIGTGLAGQYFNNQAGAAGAAAGQTALNAQLAGANTAGQLNREQFEYQKLLNEPFYNKGLSAFNQYNSAVTGEKYIDPNYHKLTREEGDALNYAYRERMGIPWDASNGGQTTYNGMPVNDPLIAAYRGPDGTYTGQPPVISWTPTESPAYKWQQEQANKNNSRTLRALGRENSSYGMGEQFKTQQNLAASEYDRQLGRLADMTNIARGGASALTGASNTYGTQASNNAITSANNTANNALMGGVLAQNNAQNNISNLYGTANLGLKAFGIQ